MIGRQTSGGTRKANPFCTLMPSSICRKKYSAAPRASDQTFARLIANQAMASNAAYSWNNEPAPNFYGAAYAGGKIPYLTSTGLTYPGINSQTFSNTVLVVPASTPRVKVTLVEHGTENPYPPGYANNLQSFCEAVPIPPVATIPAGRFTDEVGTDHVLIIVCGNEMWDFHYFTKNEPPYIADYAGYTPNLHGFNGVYPNDWGAGATSIANAGLMLMFQDMVEALEGKRIGHALGIQLPATGPGWVSPATRSDKGEGQYDSFISELHEGEPNPAYPYTDAVPEGSWVMLPPAAHPAEYGITAPLTTALFYVAQEHGFVVMNAAGTVSMPSESPISLQSPYSWVVVDPTAGATSGTWTSASKAWTTGSWAPPRTGPEALPKLTEAASGITSCLNALPWKDLELLETFSA